MSRPEVASTTHHAFDGLMALVPGADYDDGSTHDSTRLMVRWPVGPAALSVERVAEH